MQIKLFTIPINLVEDYDVELNSFLSNNKIIEIEKELIQNGTKIYWCIYITYIPKKINVYSKSGFSNKKKIDYRTLLNASEFKKFEELRVIRKQLSTEDAVSAFVVATDAELSEIVKLPEITFPNLQKVKGFGEKKCKKYGDRIIKEHQKLKNI